MMNSLPGPMHFDVPFQVWERAISDLTLKEFVFYHWVAYQQDECGWTCPLGRLHDSDDTAGAGVMLRSLITKGWLEPDETFTRFHPTVGFYEPVVIWPDEVDLPPTKEEWRQLAIQFSAWVEKNGGTDD